MEKYNLDTLVFYKDFAPIFAQVNEWIDTFYLCQFLGYKTDWYAFAKRIGYCQAVVAYAVDDSRIMLRDYEAYFDERRAISEWLDGLYKIIVG